MVLGYTLHNVGAASGTNTQTRRNQYTPMTQDSPDIIPTISTLRSNHVVPRPVIYRFQQPTWTYSSGQDNVQPSAPLLIDSTCTGAPPSYATLFGSQDTNADYS